MELNLKNVTSYDKINNTKLSLIKKINILYGQNGAGKSTISNYFYNPTAEDFSDCNCPNIANYRTLVYNTKFIEDNFYDKDSQKGIFTLSKANAEIEKEINNKIALRESLKTQYKEKKENQKNFIARNDAAEKTCIESIWSKTELIRNSKLNLLMKGFLGSKKNFYTKVKSTPRLPAIDLNTLSSEYSELLKHKNSPIPIITPYSSYKISDNDELLLKTPIIDSSNSYLSDTIKKLQNLDWIKKGKENYLSDKTCPFCQEQTIDEKFTKALELIFDESYAQKVALISTLKSTYELNAQAQLNTLKDELEKCTALSIEEQQMSIAHIASIEKMIKNNINSIILKIQNPSTSIILSSDDEIEQALHSNIIEYNTRIKSLNEKVNKFNITEKQIQGKIWGALRDFCNSEFEILEKAQAENKNKIDDIQKEMNSIELAGTQNNTEIKTLRNQVSNIGTTIDSINSKLKNLGINCFNIIQHPTVKNSYVISRSDNSPNKNVYKSLSEGEKTLISFLYFIECCKGRTEENETDSRDCLIVIDDPISSLSQNYIYDIASMIHYEILKSPLASKVIILTHNLYFFHELIKLAPKSENTFNRDYQLIRIMKNEYSSFSNIGRDSLQNEYQSLWQILKDARDGKVHKIVIPNTMRNILEYYFAFVHKTNELQNALNELALKESNSNFRAFYRYINRGSHSDAINITDMGEISPETYISQLREIFTLMGDALHFKRMYEEKQDEEVTTA